VPAAKLVLDTRDLSVAAVELLPSKAPLPFKLGQRHKVRRTNIRPWKRDKKDAPGAATWHHLE
jgi:hypothetical protein